MNASTPAATQALKAPTVKLLIGGKMVESQTTQWRDVVNPATQEVLARVPFCTPAEVDAAVASAQEAFKTWKKTPIGTRARIFLKLQQLRFPPGRRQSGPPAGRIRPCPARG